jgi:hypothetical protein
MVKIKRTGERGLKFKRESPERDAPAEDKEMYDVSELKMGEKRGDATVRSGDF